MSQSERHAHDHLAALAAELDHRLASGTDNPQPGIEELNSADAAELKRAEECLQFIDRVRLRSQLSSVEFLSSPIEMKHAFPWPEVSNGDETPPPRIGRFQIVRELGRGGYGVVFLARDVELDRDVALKLPHPPTLFSESTRERFLREGRTVASLRHPNIVPIYDVGRMDLVCYMVSAYCRGPSLAEWIASQEDPVDCLLAARLVRDLALAIDHAHKHQVIHRDLKPSNVLLEQPAETDTTTDGSQLTPMVTDFGLAKDLTAEEDLTLSGATVGTPAYMSPEQAAGAVDGVGPASDIYSLGAILYELLTGRRVFEQASVLATLRAIQSDEIVHPATLRPDLPQALENICLNCLEKQPDNRYDTAAELADTLDRFVQNPDGTSGDLTKSVHQPSSRRRASRWLTPCLAVILAATAMYVARQTSFPPSPPPIDNAANGGLANLGIADTDLPPESSSEPETPVMQAVVSHDAPVVAPVPPPPPDYALAFDDNRDYVDIPTLQYDGSHPITLEATVDVCGDSLGRIIAGYGDKLSPSLYVLQSVVNARVYGTSLKWKPNQIPIEGRRHIACCWDGTTLQLYVNGHAVGLGQRGIQNRFWLRRGFRIGGLYEFLWPTAHFYGTIDEVRISSVVRYEEDFTPAARLEADEQTMALYDFNAGSGDVLQDRSGNGHHGTIHGARWARLINGDAEMKRLDTEYPDLRALAATGLTDESSRSLERFRVLQWLSLAESPITDRTLASVGKLRRLRQISIRGATSISDEGLAHLKTLPLLETLAIEDAPLTDQSLEQLQALPFLRTLKFARTEMTDDGLRFLAMCRRLQIVELDGIGVTDKGLMQLAKCRNLQTVSLQGTQVTSAGMKRFHDALPTCMIYRDGNYIQRSRVQTAK